MVFEQKYTDEQRELALALVAERTAADPKDRSIIREVAAQVGVGEQSLRLWVRREQQRATSADGVAGKANGADSDALAELRAEVSNLRDELKVVREENDILKKAFKIFTSGWSN